MKASETAEGVTLNFLCILCLLLTAGALHAETDVKKIITDSPRATSATVQASTSSTTSQNQTPFQKEAMKQSPSFQSKKWTGTQAGYETNVQVEYVGGANQNLGNGQNQNIQEGYLDVRHTFMRHTLLAFLVQGGVEYQHLGFDVADAALIPHGLNTLFADLALDSRWSKKDLLHIGTRPGFYTDFQGSGWDAVNAPLDVGYTRVVNNNFQWVLGFNYNSWRSHRFLGAPGLRWQINDRWRIKAYLPTPDIEYAARPNLTLLFAGDFRGDSYRVGPHFGSDRGHPNLNNALMDYQEARVGPGFSWNVRPLIEINFMTGYMVGRQYDFHNEGVVLNGSGSVFVSLAVHALFKFPGEPLAIPQRNNISIHDVLSYF